jgi:hypothetical protein
MRRSGRPILGLVSGLLWGLGVAVLISMFGLSTLNPPLLYGLTGGAAAISWAWSRRAYRGSGLHLLVLAVLLPGILAAQEGECEVWVDPGDTNLNSTSPSNPIVIDPDNEDPITVVVWSPMGVEDGYAEIWLEVGGVAVPLRSGSISGNEFIRRFDPDELLTPFGVLPGLHHVGGSIDGVCDVDGYVRVEGNPLTNPVGQAAVALVVIGLGGTWIASRPARPSPSRPAAQKPSVQPEPPAEPPPEPEPPPPEPEPPRSEEPAAEEPTGEEPPPVPVEARWLQARIFDRAVEQTPISHFRPDTSHDIEVRIGPEELGWLAGTTPFPEDQLPGAGPHRLTVVLTEPHLLRTPQVSRIMLPEQGTSTSAWFELRTRADTTLVEARLVVLYGNRVLHTARLPAQVADAPLAGEVGVLTVDDVAEIETVVRTTAGLATSAPFDAAFVVNHDARGVGRVTKIAGGEAREVDLNEQDVADAIRLITERLGEIVQQPADFEGIAAPGTTELLIYLARHGALLRQMLVEDFLGDLAGAARLQVVSARADAYYPFEFAYDFDPPHQPEVTLCAAGVRLLTDGARESTCPAPHDSSVICPLGFWGLSKTIERHTFQQPGRGYPRFLVRSQPTEGRDRITLGAGSMFAASNRVDAFAPGSIGRVAATLAATSGGHSLRADTWEEWTTDVLARRPALLILLPHTVYDDASGFFGLEIGDHDRRMADQIDEQFVPPEDRPVIVSLLGCETAVAGEISFERLPGRFRQAGAEIVLGTITEVLGRHAAPIAERLVTVLHAEVEDGATTLGDVMVVLRRRLLAEGMAAVLAVTAFGDAAWLIER